MPPTFNLFGTILSEAWDETDVTPGRVSAWLDANRDALELVVNINSPGGDAFAGNTIYNLLKQHPARKVVNVLGLAASAASTVMMAGDEIIVSDGAFVMIHNVSAFTYGDAAEHRASADRLETHNASVAAIYAARTGNATDRILEMMDAETWMNASEAVTNGFANHSTALEAVPPPTPAPGPRAFNFRHVPAGAMPYLSRIHPPRPSTSALNATESVAPGGRMKTVLARLGLPENADEAYVLARVTNMLDLERDVLSITGAQNLESARGIMQANKASATELLTVKAKLETLESERRSERVTNLIEKGRADRKLTPALEAWAKTQTPEALEAFLSAAPTITALAAPENLEPGEGKGGAQITHNGKTWDQLEPADKHNLYIENKALYDQMRAAARQN